jgi:hypothetical protein
MERFFLSRSAQVISGAMVGFVLGVALKNALVAFIGPQLFKTLTSGKGLFMVIVIVMIALFVSFTIYARLNQRHQ